MKNIKAYFFFYLSKLRFLFDVIDENDMKGVFLKETKNQNLISIFTLLNVILKFSVCQKVNLDLFIAITAMPFLVISHILFMCPKYL